MVTLTHDKGTKGPKLTPRTDSTRPPKSARKGTRVGQEIIAGLTDILESVRAGEPPEKRFTVRAYHLPAPPKAYPAKAVRALRDRLNASQALFARILGVSAKLVQAWEQGDRIPAPVVCRLFEAIEREPAQWKVTITEPRPASATASASATAT